MNSPTPTSNPSLSEIHRSVAVPAKDTRWKKLLAFFGPAYLISVGYMDPGNWATDIEGGSRFGYTLVWVLLASNLMAVLLQTLSARLGIASGRDLAQACRDNYPRPVALSLWLLCELAIAACDLAEVLGTAIGLQLLFGLPLIAGVLITAVDSLFFLAIQNLGVRKFEAFILSMVLLVGLCFVYQLALSQPSMAGIISGCVPSLPADAVFVALGIIGATVMPHNLYLHSALVQTRSFATTDEGKKSAARYNIIDTTVALNAALLVNGALLVLAASAFHARGIAVTDLAQAHQLLAPLLGTSAAATAFAIALIAAGQSSTLTGTLAGQIVMEGFLRFKMRPVLRRLLTRTVAIVPAIILLTTQGESGTYSLLLLSQVILSLQLPFAIVPLIHFTSNRSIMGVLTSPRWVTVAAWVTAAVIIALNMRLAHTSITAWIAESAHPVVTAALIIPAVAVVLFLLGYVIVQPLLRSRQQQRMGLGHENRSGHSAFASADAFTPAPMDMLGEKMHYRLIAVAVTHDAADECVLRHAITLCKAHSAQMVLLHVVEGAVGSVFGNNTFDAETRHDEQLMNHLCARVQEQGIDCTALLGYGNVPKELIRLSRQCAADALVMGGHGHRGWKDLLFGSTVSPVRHALSIPVLVVR
jgi:manganese transport protein